MKAYLLHHDPALEHFMSGTGGRDAFIGGAVVLVLPWLSRR